MKFIPKPRGGLPKLSPGAAKGQSQQGFPVPIGSTRPKIGSGFLVGASFFLGSGVLFKTTATSTVGMNFNWGRLGGHHGFPSSSLCKHQHVPFFDRQRSEQLCSGCVPSGPVFPASGRGGGAGARRVRRRHFLSSEHSSVRRSQLNPCGEEHGVGPTLSES